MPKAMHKEFADVIQKFQKSGEISPQTIMDKFKEEYLENEEVFKLINFKAVYLNDNDDLNTKLIYHWFIMAKPRTNRLRKWSNQLIKMHFLP